MCFVNVFLKQSQHFWEIMVYFIFFFSILLFVSNGFELEKRLFLEAFGHAILFCFLIFENAVKLIFFSLDRPFEREVVQLHASCICIFIFVPQRASALGL